ncbi:hypothetical protein AMS68_000017 [Peltaster fructicola]|uniref:Heterokaryon incompatibility domain-containing protein n=1 Tax=Peltaster fructicola TaxID=286661 RepID=A0A6H0XIZ1_9PEZI|nr:hypothetical protein AMS68_000017 [Peltaster fructicola]
MDSRRLLRYQYQPLTAPTQIRILRLYARSLRPADDESPMLRCDIFHTDLEDEPIYKAISYAWGDMNTQTHTTIQLGTSWCMEISDTLHTALSQFQPSNEDEYIDLWADQICIDQRFNDEKSHQVGMMGRIYEMAECVLIWLGDSEPDIAAAFAMIDQVHFTGRMSCFEADSRTAMIDSVQSHGLLVELTAGGHAQLHAGLDGARALLAKPWFLRLWALQEIVVSRAHLFCCGAHRCQLRDLRALVTLLDLKLGYRVKCPVEMIWRQYTRYHDGRRYFLHEQLHSLSRYAYQTSEPHDRVYAVLALQPPVRVSGHCDIPVDYNMPLEALLTKTTLCVINNTSLSILEGREPMDSDDLPSWVPTWRRPRRENLKNRKSLNA